MPTPLTTKFNRSIADIDASAWNELCHDQPPFMRHEFLLALETCNCVGDDSGWLPCHLSFEDDSGSLLAAVPLYRKYNSWGEFVFDWAWADAYQRYGLAYYPKLVSASPFTPASAKKILHNNALNSAQIWSLAAGCIKQYAAENNLSSWHTQFITAEERTSARAEGLILREDCQFHWHNKNYESFEHFLASFSSAKRKKVRRERRRMAEAGIEFTWHGGHELSDNDWNDAFQLIRRTFLMRGNEPYLSLEFFKSAATLQPGAFQVVFASCRQQRIAAAICFASDTHLYGRYWGALDNFHSLHFETCYYQGIEFCIDNGLQCFEPGTQGEHKVSRGFEPTTTYSAHWLSDPRFADAIEAHLAEESRHVQRYAEHIRAHTPFRKNLPDS